MNFVGHVAGPAELAVRAGWERPAFKLRQRCHTHHANDVEAASPAASCASLAWWTTTIGPSSRSRVRTPKGPKSNECYLA